MDFTNMLVNTYSLPKRGDVAFVHYYHPPVGPQEVCKMVKGSPFKSTVMNVITFYRHTVRMLRHDAEHNTQKH